jgi:hypothetical protein
MSIEHSFSSEQFTVVLTPQEPAEHRCIVQLSVSFWHSSHSCHGASTHSPVSVSHVECMHVVDEHIVEPIRTQIPAPSHSSCVQLFASLLHHVPSGRLVYVHISVVRLNASPVVQVLPSSQLGIDRHVCVSSWQYCSGGQLSSVTHATAEQLPWSQNPSVHIAPSGRGG